MVRWSQPVGFFLFINLLGFATLAITLDLILYVTRGTRELAYGLGVALVVTVVGYGLYRSTKDELFDHLMSRWRMDVDQVQGRLEAAMWVRGVRVAVERDGDRVTYPLPPLSIVIAPGRWRTRVYVGPSTEDNELLVYRLEAFVERALKVS